MHVRAHTHAHAHMPAHEHWQLERADRNACAWTLAAVCVYYCRTFYKAVRVGEEESGGHVL